MTLTNDQQLALAQRIADQFNYFVEQELTYQIENMKDIDQIDHSYYETVSDIVNIKKLVIDLIAVPVA